MVDLAQLMVEDTSSNLDMKDTLSEESCLEEPSVGAEPENLPSPIDAEETSLHDVEIEEEPNAEFEVSDCLDAMEKEESLEKVETLTELVENIERNVIETPISSIVVPLEQHQENTVETSNLFDMAQQISNGNLKFSCLLFVILIYVSAETDADHNQVIEDVLKAEEEGVVKSLGGNDVRSELLQHADNDLLLQAQFWTMDQSPANLLGNSTEQNVISLFC